MVISFLPMWTRLNLLHAVNAMIDTPSAGHISGVVGRDQQIVHRIPKGWLPDRQSGVFRSQCSSAMYFGETHTMTS
jgi:hypothetical protein